VATNHTHTVVNEEVIKLLKRYTGKETMTTQDVLNTIQALIVGYNTIHAECEHLKQQIVEYERSLRHAESQLEKTQHVHISSEQLRAENIELEKRLTAARAIAVKQKKTLMDHESKLDELKRTFLPKSGFFAEGHTSPQSMEIPSDVKQNLFGSSVTKLDL
jgi:chromosome segregation ATPase